MSPESPTISALSTPSDDAPTADSSSGRGRTASRTRESSLKREGQKWTRLVHVYASMIALVIVLFFGVTGITLNHPDWTFGFDPTLTDTTGTLPEGTVDDAGAVDYLALSEYLRSVEGVTGTVTDYGLVGSAGYLSYRGPGYAADATFDTATGTYELRIEEQGFMAVLNDLHKGRNTASAWNWTIDVAGAFLVLIALTGLFLQLFLRKRRTSAIVVATVGGAIAVVLTWIAIT